MMIIIFWIQIIYFRESKFFRAYLTFRRIYYKKASKYFRLIHKHRDSLEKTTKSYFEEFYYNLQRSKPKVSFAAKIEGTLSGIIVTVDHCQGATKYFMKTNHNAGPVESAVLCPLNLKELFAYKLLERIGVFFIYLLLLAAYYYYLGWPNHPFPRK